MTAGLANEVTKMEITPSSRPARDPNYLNWSGALMMCVAGSKKNIQTRK